MTLNLSTLYGSVGPTNTNIADAVAADSNMAATIAANVPSASTIATAVAGAVTSGFGNNYTLLTSGAVSGTSTTLTWSGSYKKIHIVLRDIYGTSAIGDLLLRFNGDSSANYVGGYFALGTNNSNPVQQAGTISYLGYNGIIFGYGVASTSNYCHVVVDGANTSTNKLVTSVGFGNASSNALWQTDSIYITSSPITSMTVTNGNAGSVSASTAYAYVFGEN